MLKLILYIFFGYLLYKLVFDFIIPVYRSARQVRQQMGDIQQRMRQQFEEQQGAQQGYSQQRQAAPQPAPKSDKGDYIDFEEIKN